MVFISGTFYNAQGRVIAGPDQISSYCPADAIPVGGQLPFTLNLDEIQNVATYNIDIEGESADYVLHQDFEFLELNQWQQEGNYCVSGKFRNQGVALEAYAVPFMVLYNNQDQVVNFADYYAEEALNNQTLDFEVCIETDNQTVNRYKLQAWGE